MLQRRPASLPAGFSMARAPLGSQEESCAAWSPELPPQATFLEWPQGPIKTFHPQTSLYLSAFGSWLTTWRTPLQLHRPPWLSSSQAIPSYTLTSGPAFTTSFAGTFFPPKKLPHLLRSLLKLPKCFIRPQAGVYVCLKLLPPPKHS